MVILPAVLGAVSLLIDPDDLLAQAGRSQPASHPNGTATTVLLILAVGACFAGAANSVRELIKERVIYERERATGLSRSAYLMSKVIVLGVITALQGVIICASASPAADARRGPDLRRSGCSSSPSRSSRSASPR